MTTFTYTAKKTNAETVTGTVSARSQDEAIDLISQLGYLPVRIEAQQGSQKILTAKESKASRIRSRELYMFSQQLANLLRSGVSLLRALVIVEDQTANPNFKSVISSLIQGIKNGRAFSDCLADYPNIFSSLYVTMVHAGEESGNLQELLINLANHQRNQEEIMSKVRTALAYPCLMALVGVGTVYFILTFALPKMTSLFEHMGKLPLPTVVLIGVSNFLSKTWLYLLIAILGFAAYVKHWVQTEQGRAVLSRVLIKIPLFGDVLLKSELARFARTMTLLLKSGVSIVHSLSIAIPIMGNDLIKAQLTRCKDSLTTGGALGQSLKQSPSIPIMMSQLVSVGEESGNLPLVFNEIAENYEQETSEKIKILTTLLEPMMILLIGVVVGFIVFGMLLPIFQIDVMAN